jgi:O-antigen chain-terminating methyltransferase
MNLAATLAALRERIQQRVEGRVPVAPDLRLPKLDRLEDCRRIAGDWAASAGRVNPRPPGPHHALIQLFKRIVARSLRWYGYPQRQFNQTVLEALAETQQLLAEHNRNLLVVAQVAAQGESLRAQALAELQRLSQDLTAFQAEPQAEWRKRLDEHKATLDGRIMADVARLDVAAGELRVAVANLRETAGKMQEELLARLARVDGDVENEGREWRKHLRLNVDQLNEAMNRLQQEFWRYREELTGRVEEEMNLVRLRLRSLTAAAPAVGMRNAECGMRSGDEVTPHSALRTPHLSPQPSAELATTEFDYPHFEDLYRGSDKEVRERQAEYLPLFEGHAPVLDVACGHGAFLALLREKGIEACGVDLDPDMVARCREQQLDVTQADAFEYLESLPDDSLGGIFSAQFIEHLPAPGYVRLVRLAHRKLRAGGVLVLETPNPECLATLSQSFFLDPTHAQPIPSGQLRFFMEEAGFTRISIRHVSPVQPRLPELPLWPESDASPAVLSWNREARRFNAKYFGYQDYALIGFKPSESRRP